MANPVGRPSKYNAELQARADKYVYDFHEQGDVIPSVAGLCCWLGISRFTAYKWRDEIDAFSNTIKAIDVLQENLTLNRAMEGKFNPTIAKLLLASNHGYTDKVQQDSVSSDGTMTPKPALDVSKLSQAARKEILNAAGRADD